MGRPLKEINWEMVEKRMEAGCSGAEIAATLRIDPDTLYDRFKLEYGESFSGYSGKFYNAGISDQKFVTHIRALSKSGSTQLLIRYNEERLGWGKTKETNLDQDEITALRHENMILKNEIQKKNDNEPKTEWDYDKPGFLFDVKENIS